MTSELICRIRDNIGFKRDEIKHLLLISLVCGLAIGLDDGRAEFDLVLWSLSLVGSIIAVFLAMSFRWVFMKILGLKHGYLLEFSLWTYGLAAGAVGTILSMGKVYLLMPFSTKFIHHKGMRLGAFRYGIDTEEMGKISLYGILGNLFIAALIRLFIGQSSSIFLRNLMFANVFLAIFTLVPLPALDGIKIFIWSRILYVMWATLVVVFGLLILIFPSVWPALIYSIISGIAFAWLFWFWVER